jgi:hypothetical protein
MSGADTGSDTRTSQPHSDGASGDGCRSASQTEIASASARGQRLPSIGSTESMATACWAEPPVRPIATAPTAPSVAWQGAGVAHVPRGAPARAARGHAMNPAGWAVTMPGFQLDRGTREVLAEAGRALNVGDQGGSGVGDGVDDLLESLFTDGIDEMEAIERQLKESQRRSSAAQQEGSSTSQPPRTEQLGTATESNSPERSMANGGSSPIRPGSSAEGGSSDTAEPTGARQASSRSRTSSPESAADSLNSRFSASDILHQLVEGEDDSTR